MFSRPGTYTPVGLFSITHIISIIMCFVLIALVVILTRKMKSDIYFKLIKILAPIITALELFKICWSLIMGVRNLDSWLPLYFCSLFIYSLWFSASKNDKLKQIGMSYISLAGIICGAVFIISPSTSFRLYPIYHFQCIYSMIYHSIMVYCGIMCYVTNSVKINFKSVVNYIIFCAIFMTLAIIVNLIFDTNMMFLSDPYFIPLHFLATIYEFSHILYTALMVIAHMLIGFIVWGIYALIVKIKHRFVKSESIDNSDSILKDDEYIEKHT